MLVVARVTDDVVMIPKSRHEPMYLILFTPLLEVPFVACPPV